MWHIFIMACQSVTDGYIIMTASILAVKIVLPNSLLIKTNVTPKQHHTPPTIETVVENLLHFNTMSEQQPHLFSRSHASQLPFCFLILNSRF